MNAVPDVLPIMRLAGWIIVNKNIDFRLTVIKLFLEG